MMDASLRNDLTEAVDGVWSETVRHLPLKTGEPDETRERVVFSAVLRTGAREGADVRPGRADREGAQVMGDGGTLRVDRTAWPELVLRAGDKIVAIGRAGAPAFEILAVDDRHHLRLICQLGDVN